MKAQFMNVLFVAPEQREFQGNTYYKAVVVDDQGSFDRLEISIDLKDLGKLPVPRSRVNVEVEVVQRQNKIYLQNPSFSVVKSA